MQFKRKNQPYSYTTPFEIRRNVPLPGRDAPVLINSNPAGAGDVKRRKKMFVEKGTFNYRAKRANRLWHIKT